MALPFLLQNSTEIFNFYDSFRRNTCRCTTQLIEIAGCVKLMKNLIKNYLD